jgi:uncharacterized damage-inducible protein DinB
MSFNELLVSPFAYAPPAHVLEGLSDADAVRHIDGTPHTVAQVVAHMAFWQEWFLDRCRGAAVPMVAHAAHGWPAAPPGSWDETRGRFLEGLRQAASAGSNRDRLNRPLSPAIEFPPLAHYTMTDALTHVAVHNAHHLGQVVVLRQLLGKWPPPAGGWTW